MRKFFITLIVLALLAGALAIYLVATTPKVSAGVRFPLSASQRALLAGVPAGADAFALIPTAAALEATLRANPTTRASLEEWASRQTLPQPWMIGGADVVMWREGKQTRYLVRLDPLRALLVRGYLMMSDGDSLLLEPPSGEAIPAEELDRIVALAGKLPAGEAFVAQRLARGNAFPPIGRPAVTSLQVHAGDIVVTSRAALDPGVAAGPLKASFPGGAIFTIAFAQPPRSVNDLNRLLGTKVASLLDGGGQLAVYDVETRKLLPRPRGVIAVPADDAHRATLDDLLKNLSRAEAVGVQVRTAERDGRLLIAFDDSIDLYIKDAMEPAAWPAARWALRMDPRRLVPVVEKLHDDLGLRIAAPHIYGAVKDLNRWIATLQSAQQIEAVDTVDADAEQLVITLR